MGGGSAAGAGLGSLGLHRAAAPRQVEVFDVDLEQFFCASAGFVEHSPQRLLPDVDVAAGDELVDRGARVRRVAPVSYC